ncbi:MAG: hypothetical protein M3436_00675 [Pseudomonadota bacterium]|nr:hypothetical protein [Pseudomonadota bacterium]
MTACALTFARRRVYPASWSLRNSETSGKAATDRRGFVVPDAFIVGAARIQDPKGELPRPTCLGFLSPDAFAGATKKRSCEGFINLGKECFYMSTQDLPAFTPETFFIPDPTASHELHLDLLSTLLARAHGIVMLLSSDAEERLAEGNSVELIYVANALDAVDGLLKQVDTVILYSIMAEAEKLQQER